MTVQQKRRFGEKAKRWGGHWVLMTLMALSTFGLAGGYFLSWISFEPVQQAQTSTTGELVRRETKPTLSPALFVGKAAKTHQIAQEIPDVLDQLYCYCECDKFVGHKSLLSCYTDGHAAT